MTRQIALFVAVAATMAPSLAIARKPFFGRTMSRPPAASRPMANHAMIQSSRSMPTSVLQDEAEMTRRFGPSVLESSVLESSVRESSAAIESSVNSAGRPFVQQPSSS